MAFDSNLEFYAKMRDLRKQAEARGEPLFMREIPEEWFEPKPRWRCRNDHVSRYYIKSEARRGDCCPVCFEYVCMTFPGDEDGTPLPDRLPEYELTWDGT
jgi:hypothetical protein